MDEAPHPPEEWRSLNLCSLGSKDNQRFALIWPEKLPNRAGPNRVSRGLGSLAAGQGECLSGARVDRSHAAIADLFTFNPAGKLNCMRENWCALFPQPFPGNGMDRNYRMYLSQGYWDLSITGKSP
jgi:hypothetical protein